MSIVLNVDEDEPGAGGNQRRYRGVYVVIGVIVALALLVGLYQAKTRAQATRRNIAELEQQLKVTQRAISAREAEIALLENPERLREIARRKLNLAPVTPGQLKSLDALPESGDHAALKNVAPVQAN